MSLRVVLYAEGGLDLSGETYVQRAPGSPIDEDSLGAAHFLVRRALTMSHGLPEQAVRFEEPLRDRGMVARGTALYNPPSLQRLLTWPANPRRPELAVVLVDADGESQRHGTLLRATEAVTVPRVIGVAIQEFESWLIADQSAVNKVFKARPSPGEVEKLNPRDAKEQLDQWIDDVKGNRTALRRELAKICDLDEVERKCEAFRLFRKDLAASKKAA